MICLNYDLIYLPDYPDSVNQVIQKNQVKIVVQTTKRQRLCH